MIFGKRRHYHFYKDNKLGLTDTVMDIIQVQEPLASIAVMLVMVATCDAPTILEYIIILLVGSHE